MKNDGCILPAGCSTIGVLVMGASFSSSTANKLVLVHQLGMYITAYENKYSIPVGDARWLAQYTRHILYVVQQHHH